MNEQIFVPRGDKSKEMRKREYKEQLTDPRKPCGWKKLRWTCKSRKNEIDPFFSQELEIDISATKKQMQQYHGRKCSCLLHGLPSKCTETRDKFFLKDLGVSAPLPL